MFGTNRDLPIQHGIHQLVLRIILYDEFRKIANTTVPGLLIVFQCFERQHLIAQFQNTGVKWLV